MTPLQYALASIGAFVIAGYLLSVTDWRAVWRIVRSPFSPLSPDWPHSDGRRHG